MSSALTLLTNPAEPVDIVTLEVYLRARDAFVAGLTPEAKATIRLQKELMLAALKGGGASG